jgi:imidazolonepropionase-like amidohydrolase
MKFVDRASLLLVFLALQPASAEDIVILADVLHTAGPAGVIRDGAVVIADGRISAVGRRDELRLPADATTHRAAVVTPGLIDTRTTLGLSGMFNVPSDQDHDELTGASQAQLRAIDSYNPSEPLIGYVRAHGVTAVHATPGDSNVIAGQGAVFKTAGDTVEAAVLKPVASMLFNLGETPKAAYAEKVQPPGTRMATAAIIRQALLDAAHYAEHGAQDGKTDLALEALARVVAGELPAVFTAHREDDIATALRIGREFGIVVWIQYATEGYLARDALAESGSSVLAGPALQRLRGLESLNASLENAALLRDAGVPVTFSTGHEAYVPKQRVLLFEIAVAVANGFPADAAIRAATIDAATLLGVNDRIGSIERGKDADLVLFDGDPFEYTSHVTAVFIDGVPVHLQ